MTPDEKTLTKSDVERIIGEPILDFTLSSGSKQGDNVAGNLLVIQATTKSSPKEPLQLVYKSFPTGDAEQMMWIVQSGIFRTETCVYEKVIPRLIQLLELRCKKDSSKFLPVPKYFSGFNDDQNDYVAIEDLRPLGFIMQDKYHSLTVAEVSLVMKEIGRWHALTHFLLRYDGERPLEEDERLRKLKYNILTVEDPFMSEMFSRMFHSYMENTVELLEPRDKELSKAMAEFVGKSNRHRMRALQRFNLERTDKTVFPCILHGDLWTNNILFKYGEKGNRNTPVELKLIDFQMTRRGNLFEDLGYFFWTSTTPQFRKEHLTSMLGLYYDAFEGMMKELDWPKPEGFTKGKLIDGFSEGILPAYVYMPFALSLQMGDLSVGEKKGEDGEGGKGKPNGDGAAPPAPKGGPPPMEMMVAENKKMMMLRMKGSQRAMDRLEELTREIVEMGLLK